MSTFTSYDLVDVIGQGGNGEVWRANDDAGVQVAIKILDSTRTTSTTLKRFRNEIEFCGRDHHANIIRVLDSGRTDTGRPGYVMSIYPGTLRRVIPFDDVASALRAFDAIAAALECAHKQRVWHRDLKPENVLVAADGAPVVTDFGIAHFDEEFLVTAVQTKQGERLANFVYAAPEQCQKGALVDQRCDVFAMGLMLNEIITGCVPRGAAFKTIADVDRHFAFLDEVVHAMINNKPENRPTDAAAVRQLLRAHSMAADSARSLDALKAAPLPVQHEALAPRFEIVSIDHKNGHVVLELNAVPPGEWMDGMRQVANRMTSNFHVGMIRLYRNELWLPDQDHFTQDNVNMTKEFVQKANDFFQERKRQQARHAAAEAKKLRDEAIAAEARRLKVRSTIKI